MTAAVLIWIVGLFTAVPYAVWYLWFQAPREQYALLITGVLFWMFGYWSVVGPIVLIVKVRAIWRRLEAAPSADERKRLLLSPESKEVAIDVIAAESRLPRFLARWMYDTLLRRLSGTSTADGVSAK